MIKARAAAPQEQHPYPPAGLRAPHRLTLIAQEIPYPPTHGGRVDMWRRMQAFARAGVKLQLIYWSEQPPEPVTLAEISRVAVAQLRLSFKQDWFARLRTAAALMSTPAPVGTRRLDAAECAQVTAAVREFGPDALWLDQLYGAGLALDLAQRLRLPLLTRSHNIEHRYWADQLRAARGIAQQARIRARLLSLERYEHSVLRRSHRFYDISVDDLEYWKGRGLHNGRWLPPLHDTGCSGDPQQPVKPRFEVGFVGNLFMPNNVEAVKWLLTRVMPEVRAAMPGATVLIAGSSPVAAARQLVAADPLAELRENLADTREAYRDCRVLVNPMLRGGGVALKSVDMLTTPCGLVSTSRGLNGLPAIARRCFLEGDDAQGFARAILQALRDGAGDAGARREAVRLFSGEALQVVYDELSSLGGQTCCAGASR